MATSLLEKMLKSGSIKTTTLGKSIIFHKKEMVQTPIPIINVAFSGELDGGMISGLTVVAGNSRNFKSNLGLVCVKSYMDKYPESICLFYDSEFGITPDYITSNGIDAERVIHIPVEHIEQLKFDIAQRLNDIVRGDKVIIFVDSLGNLASKKEAEDALEGKGAADLTRAKQIKSLFRIITPHLTTKDLPCIVINHIYMEQGLYPKAILAGGTGVMLSANNVWIIGRSQDKQADEIAGWNFTINIEKSRFVKEKAKLTFNVNYEKGISKWSGLMDLAKEFGFVTCPVQGWYSRVGEDKKWRLKDTECKEFWMPILSDKSFRDSVAKKFKVSSGSLDQFSENEAAEIIEEILDSEDEV